MERTEDEKKKKVVVLIEEGDLGFINKLAKERKSTIGLVIGEAVAQYVKKETVSDAE